MVEGAASQGRSMTTLNHGAWAQLVRTTRLIRPSALTNVTILYV
jgi:hypothetical protein